MAATINHVLTVSERNLSSKIHDCAKQVLIYEDAVLQSLARSLIPIEKLEKQAAEKSGESADSAKTRDFLILELLRWFKYDFFSWTDAPKCIKCGEKTKFSSNASPTAQESAGGAGRVEAYECETCQIPCRFPRYNNPAKLLETRTGRCGEWANCFTLCARAVGFEARYILDLTDHVWTEIYSTNQKRWLHCDSCENACDSPLTYEKGWGKKLSHVIAFSRDEVRDVTWRYSVDHRATIKRRRPICREIVLLNMIEKINAQKMAVLPKGRLDELKERQIFEIVELLTPRDLIKEEETGGRISGDLEWREQRGELGQGKAEDFKPCIIIPTTSEIESGLLSIDYFSFSDTYRRYQTNEKYETIKDWKSLVKECSNIFRKEEFDWKQVYLCRRDGTKEGNLVWSFEIPKNDEKTTFQSLEITINTLTYENGRIRAILCFKNTCLMLKSNTKEIINLDGCQQFKLEIILNGGTGDNAWQHSQIFRAPFDSKEPSFSIRLHLKR